MIDMRVWCPHHFCWRIGSINLFQFCYASIGLIVVQNLITILKNVSSPALHLNSLLGSWRGVIVDNGFVRRSCTSQCHKHSKETHSLLLFECQVFVTLERYGSNGINQMVSIFPSIGLVSINPRSIRHSPASAYKR